MSWRNSLGGRVEDRTTAIQVSLSNQVDSRCFVVLLVPDREIILVPTEANLQIVVAGDEFQD